MKINVFANKVIMKITTIFAKNAIKHAKHVA